MILAQAVGLSLQNIAYIIAACVIVFFAAAFIGISVLYFKARRKNIDNYIEDDVITEEVDTDFNKYLKKKKSAQSLSSYYDKRKKISERISELNTVIAVNLYIIAIFCVGFAFYLTSQNQTLWVLNEAGLVVETNSMATAYSGNTYLLDENGKLNEDDRIKQFTYITISRKQEYIDNAKPFDIVAFKMKSSDNEHYITVIHRLINISYDENGEPLYTFRGDANPRSMAGEINLKKDMIVGVFQTEGFQGVKNVPLGYIVSYLKSSIGMIVVITAFFLLIIYTALFDRILEVYNERYRLLLSSKCVMYDIEQAQKGTYVAIDGTYDFSVSNEKL